MQTEKNFLPTFHIFLSEDLSKEAFIHWTDIDGKRHRRKGGINRFKTYEERLKAARALVEELKVTWQKLKPVSAQMQEWIDNRKGVWRPKTYRTENSRLVVFLRWAQGKKITPELMKAFFIYLQNSVHKCTYHHYRRFFRQLCSGIGMPELCKGIEQFSYTSTPAKYFQSHQIDRIKKHLLDADPPLWLACQFIYYCFIRPGELRLVKVGDIHFDEWKVCVRSKISKNKKEQYVTVPVAFRPSLERLKMRSPNEYIFFKEDCTKPVAINYFLRKFRRVLTTLGFGTEYQLYSWKHTGAVACVKAGASLKELQIQLRHHSLEEVDKYIRQLGVHDLEDLEGKFPGI